MKIVDKYYVIATRPQTKYKLLTFWGTGIIGKSSNMMFLCENDDGYYFSDDISKAMRMANEKTCETIKKHIIDIVKNDNSDVTEDDFDYLIFCVKRTYEF